MSRIRTFGLGFKNLIAGFTYLLSHPRLWIYALLPTIINLALLGLMIGVFFHYYNDIYSWLVAHIGYFKLDNADTWYLKALAGVLWVLNLLIKLLLGVIALIFLLIISYAAGQIIAGPFNDILSERVEVLVANFEPPPFSIKQFLADTFRIIKAESMKALIFIAIPVVLFVLNFIPVFGGALYILVTCLFGSWSLGFSYVDLPNGRRALAFRDRLKFARKNKWALVGFGVGFIVPFFSLIFTAPMVVGGTLLYVECKKV